MSRVMWCPNCRGAVHTYESAETRDRRANPVGKSRRVRRIRCDQCDEELERRIR